MRYFLTLLILASSTPSISAENYMSEADIAKANAGQRGFHVYPNQGRCQSREGGPCLEVSGKNLRRMSVQDVTEDNLSRPLYGPKMKLSAGIPSLQACLAARVPDYCDDQDPGYELQSVCAVEGEGPTHELYCVSKDPRGYEQHVVRKVHPDPALEAVDDARLAEKATRASKASARETALITCAKAADLTAVQSKNCLQRLIKEVYKLKLSVDDL